MSKKFITFGILTIILAGILVPEHVAYGWFGGAVEGLVENLFKAIASILMSLSSLALLLSGYLFDEVVKFTIVDMAKNIGDSGIGGSITIAWATLRDIANMCFIFVLLFAAFKTMFNSNFGNFRTTVRNIVIIALLINFSLFLSKVVIDASNIVAIGFYNSIDDQHISIGGKDFGGISPGYMNMLGIQSIYGSKILDKGGLNAGEILVFGVLSTMLMFIVAVILLIAGIMFIARFVILVFLMVLSPLAFIAFIIPGMGDQFTKWWKSLVDQSFFAPIYFALTWVVFNLGSALVSSLEKGTEFSQLTKNPHGVIPLLFNFVLIIGFSIAALIISKTMASRGATAAAFKTITGGIGKTAGVVGIGGAAWVGRNTIGRGMRAMLESSTLRDKASEKGLGGMAARATLWTANKGKAASFDTRNTKTLGKIPGVDMFGKGGGVGGFNKTIEEKAKAKAKYAKEVYGQTDAEKEEADKLKKKYEEGYVDENGKFQKSNKTKVEEMKKDGSEKIKIVEQELENKKKQRDEAVLPEMKEVLNKEIEETEKRLKEVKDVHLKTVEGLEKLAAEDKKVWEEADNLGKERQKAYAKRVEGDLVGKTMRAAAGAVVGGVVAGPAGAIAGGWAGARTTTQGSKASARAIIKGTKEKSNKEKAADLLKKMKEDEDKESGEKNESKEKEKKPEAPKEEKTA